MNQSTAETLSNLELPVRGVPGGRLGLAHSDHTCSNELLLALEEFRSLGIQFISYQENIDTSSPLGQALFTIVSAVAQLERDLIRERVKAGLRVAKAKGVVLGRPRVAVDARAIARLRAQGHSWRGMPEA